MSQRQQISGLATCTGDLDIQKLLTAFRKNSGFDDGESRDGNMVFQPEYCTMKKIGLLSDTHGWLDDAVLRHFEACDEIWHAGDIGGDGVLEKLQEMKPVRAVWGNIDDHHMRSMCPENQRFVCEGVDVWITHIGGRPGNYALPVRDTLRNQPPALFICGHSHICMVKMDKAGGFLYMNPGAAGKHGFHQVRTILRFELERGEIKNLEAIELGARAS